MKYLLITTTSASVINFRKDLINRLIQGNHEIMVISGDRKYEREIADLKVQFSCIDVSNRDVNILRNFRYKNALKQCIKSFSPNVVFTFQAKPNIFGASAAAKSKIKNIFCMVEGTGDVFLKKSMKWGLIRFISKFLYKKSFKKAKKVFFLNHENETFFIQTRMVKKEQCVTINGIGVNLSDFPFSVRTVDNVFIMVSRLLISKGILDYCEAAQIVKKEFPETKFLLVGDEAEITSKTLKRFIEKGAILYLGHTNDIRPYLLQASVFVLPSYGEGVPKSTMEAMSMGLPIITTNVPGCKETVVEGYNGFFVNAHDPNDLAKSMKFFIGNSAKTKAMGLASRKLAEEKFDSSMINGDIVSIIDKFV